MISYQQQDILSCDENCVVIAGPGSGKTSTFAPKTVLFLTMI
ncbi:UvrD-helicase domain-containing protein [Priestia megaterium]